MSQAKRSVYIQTVSESVSSSVNYRDPTLGEAFRGIEIDSSPGKPVRHPGPAHSVLAIDYVDEPGLEQQPNGQRR